MNSAEVDAVAAELDDAAVLGEDAAVGEAARVVVDGVHGVDALHQRGDRTLAGDVEDARPNVNSSKRHFSPTVGANCRRGEQTDAMGWLKLGPNVR